MSSPTATEYRKLSQKRNVFSSAAAFKDKFIYLINKSEVNQQQKNQAHSRRRADSNVYMSVKMPYKHELC